MQLERVNMSVTRVVNIIVRCPLYEVAVGRGSIYKHDDVVSRYIKILEPNGYRCIKEVKVSAAIPLNRIVLVLKGRIDAICYNDKENKIVIIEAKSYYDSENAALLQARLYALLFVLSDDLYQKIIHNVKSEIQPEIEIHCILKGTLLRDKFTTKQFRETIAMLKKHELVISKINKGYVIPIPGKYCYACKYISQCKKRVRA